MDLDRLAEPGHHQPIVARNGMVATSQPLAAAAGLQIGDQIISVDGQDVTGANSYLYRGLTDVLEGTTVTLGLVTGKSLAVTAGKAP